MAEQMPLKEYIVVGVTKDGKAVILDETSYSHVAFENALVAKGVGLPTLKDGVTPDWSKKGTYVEVAVYQRQTKPT